MICYGNFEFGKRTVIHSSLDPLPLCQYIFILKMYELLTFIQFIKIDIHLFAYAIDPVITASSSV